MQSHLSPKVQLFWIYKGIFSFVSNVSLIPHDCQCFQNQMVKLCSDLFHSHVGNSRFSQFLDGSDIGNGFMNVSSFTSTAVTLNHISLQTTRRLNIPCHITQSHGNWRGHSIHRHLSESTMRLQWRNHHWIRPLRSWKWQTTPLISITVTVANLQALFQHSHVARSLRKWMSLSLERLRLLGSVWCRSWRVIWDRPRCRNWIGKSESRIHLLSSIGDNQPRHVWQSQAWLHRHHPIGLGSCQYRIQSTTKTTTLHHQKKWWYPLEDVIFLWSRGRLHRNTRFRLDWDVLLWKVSF